MPYIPQFINTVIRPSSARIPNFRPIWSHFDYMSLAELPSQGAHSCRKSLLKDFPLEPAYGSEISSDEISWNFIDEISMKFHWNFIVFEMIMKFHRSLFFMIPLTFNYFSVCGPPICQHYSILSLILVCIDRHNLPQLKDIQVIWLQESLKSSNYPTLYLFLLLLLCFRFSSSLCSQQDRKHGN